MSAYISLAQLKEAAGFPTPYTDTVDDGALLSCIVRASAFVDQYLRQCRPGFVGFSIGSNSHSASLGSNTRYYDGDGSDMLWIDDAQSVSSVVVDGTAIDTTSYATWPYNEIPKRALVYVRPTSSVHGLTVDIWPTGTANVAVTGFFGLASVPDEVAQVTLSISLILWRRNQRSDYAGSSQVLTRSTFSAGGGSQRQYVVDPEVDAALANLEPGWAVPGVWGG